MIYICGTVSGKIPQTALFKEKKLNGMTITTLANINIIGKPFFVQEAFPGYKDNIEAFLYATAVQAKTLTGQTSYPLPEEYRPTFPLKLPQIIFRLAQDTDAKSLEGLMKGLEKRGGHRVEIGKGRPTFTVENPSWNTYSNIKDIGLQNCPQVCRPLARCVS